MSRHEHPDTPLDTPPPPPPPRRSKSQVPQPLPPPPRKTPPLTKRRREDEVQKHNIKRRAVLSGQDILFRILLPSKQIGKVIGKAGFRIEKIRNLTQANIKIADAIAQQRNPNKGRRRAANKEVRTEVDE
nr:poly(rC)-binding protein 4 isoform X1 [Tanacetum cinerariifolium]